MIKIITTPIEWLGCFIYCVWHWMLLSIIITGITFTVFEKAGINESIRYEPNVIELPKVNNRLPVYFEIEFDENGTPRRPQ